MYDEKYIREYAKRYSFTIRRAGGSVKLADVAGNVKDCTDMQEALTAMRIYQAELLTSPVYEVGENTSKSRVWIAAPNGSTAKRMYKSRMRMTDPQSPLSAKKIK